MTLKERNRYCQSFYRIKSRVPLSQLIQRLGNWEFKLYAFLLENADESEIEDGEWVWKPFNLHEVLGISKSTLYKAMSDLSNTELIETFTGMLLSTAPDGTFIIHGTRDGKISVTPNAAKEIEEHIVRDRLKSIIGGTSEVITPAGRIDLLTNTEIIEVRRAEDWKSALGQALAYQYFYADRKAKLHLFNFCQNRKVIEQVCSQFNVAVTFEEVQ
jgi:hypothetical protein